MSRKPPIGLEITGRLRRRFVAVVRTAVTAALLLSATCTRAGRRDADLPLPSKPIGKATKHAVESRELRGIMSRLNAVASERLPQELDDSGRNLSLKRVSSFATDLAASADRVADIAGETGLTSAQQEAFRGLAVELQERSLELGAYAAQGRARLVDSTLKEIDATCLNCHALFRASSGPSSKSRR